jgi:hypothetical protein
MGRIAETEQAHGARLPADRRHAVDRRRIFDQLDDED